MDSLAGGIQLCATAKGAWGLAWVNISIIKPEQGLRESTSTVAAIAAPATTEDAGVLSVALITQECRTSAGRSAPRWTGAPVPGSDEPTLDTTTCKPQAIAANGNNTAMRVMRVKRDIDAFIMTSVTLGQGLSMSVFD